MSEVKNAPHLYEKDNKMNKTTKRPLNLFFIEMIIALLFFSISGTVILTVFAGADRKSRQSEMLESVIVFSESIAEVYSENGNADEAIKLVISECGGLDENITLLKNEEKKHSSAGTFSKLTLTFSDGDREIYRFTCAAYVQNGGNDEQI